tara:strand:- start:254 stop:433 length:180 start_codon:yes stop_codon:yes gene_type:complete
MEILFILLAVIVFLGFGYWRYTNSANYLRKQMAKRIADREKRDPEYAKELAEWRKSNPI